MSKPKKAVKKAAHRPHLDINWDRVDELLICGCYGSEIAPQLGISADTLYLRCEREKKMTFTAYSQQKKEQGNSILKEAQFKKAIGISNKGDNTLLIWLGKDRLGQKESHGDVIVLPEIAKNFENVMSQLQELQASAKKTIPS